MINLYFEDKEELKSFILPEEKTSSGNPRLTTSPWANHLRRALAYYSNPNDNLDVVEYFGNQFEINLYDDIDAIQDKPYVVPIGLNESPHEWIGQYFSKTEEAKNFKNLFDLIPPRILHDAANGKALLMFDNSLEGYYDPYIIDYFWDNATYRGIPPNQVIFVTGNLNIEQNLKNWQIKNRGKEPIQVLPYSHFEFDINERLRKEHFIKDDFHFVPTYEDHIAYKTKHNEDIKLYNFLSKKPRHHRMWFYNELREWKLLDKGIVTMPIYPNNDLKLGHFYSKSKDVITECNKTLPKYAYGDDVTDKDFSYYMYNFSQNANLDSYITIIPETHFDDEQETIFISEKTFKVIASHQPFMILGNRGSLKKLKDMGYKTFQGLIDESYDDLENLERINAIIEELRNFDNRPDKMEWLQWLGQKLIYNRNVMTFNALYSPPNGFYKIKNHLEEYMKNDNN